MKHLYILFLAAVIAGCGSSKSDDSSIKGNREPTTQITQIELFDTIEVGSEFEVGIVKGQYPGVEILTDSNLHDVIDVDVRNGTLSIRTLKKITGSKKMEIRITFTDELNQITATDKANIYSIADINLNNVRLAAQNDGRLALTIKAQSVDLRQVNGSRTELNIQAESIIANIADNADAEALFNAKNLSLNIANRADVRYDGDVDEATITLKDKSEFEGKRMDIKNLNLNIENDARATVTVIKNLNLTSRNDGETTLYGQPQIKISEFKNESKLLKED